MKGTVRFFDPASNVGEVELDDGRVVGFDGAGCKGGPLAVGARLSVDDVHEAFGKLMAKSLQLEPMAFDVEVSVWPVVIRAMHVEQRWVDGVSRQVRVRSTLFDRDAVARGRACWPEPELLLSHVLPMAAPDGDDMPALPPPHELFAPWHDAIVRTAAFALRLTPSEDGRGSCLGGTRVSRTRPWPQCSRGHGPMTLLVTLAPDDLTLMRSGIGPSRLTLDLCVPCVGDEHAVWLGRTDSAASVEWSRNEGEVQECETEDSLPPFPLAARWFASLPHAWMFEPRRDVEGHEPIGDLPAKLFEVHLTQPGSTSTESADFVYERHYAQYPEGVFVGGHSTFRYARCPVCREPMKQWLYVSDYFTDGELADRLQGKNELTLLACTRTPECGGPERGLLLIDP